MSSRALPLFLIFTACAGGPLGAGDTTDGDTTTPGNTSTGSFTVETEAPGEHCATGGIVLTTATTTSYVCNGLAGANAADAAIADEPAGVNCAAGGVSVATTSTVFYICDGANGVDGTNGTNGTNGVDGATYTITAEPAGLNCKTGGVRVSGADGVHFVCNGGADTGRCEPANPGLQFYVTLSNSVLGQVRGSVTKTGFQNQMLGLGYCYNQRVPYDTTTGGVFPAQQKQSPFVLFLGDDVKAWPSLAQIWDQQSPSTLAMSFYARSPDGAKEIRTDVITLTTSTIAAMRYFAGEGQNFIELAFEYKQIDWQDFTKSIDFVDAPTAFVAPIIETEACVAPIDFANTEYVTTTGPVIAGDVSRAGRIGQIQVAAACQTLATYDGHRQHFPFALVKQNDSSSLAFRQALASGTAIRKVNYERVGRSADGAKEIVTERITLTNAHVVAFDDVPSAVYGVPLLERIAFTYETIEFVSVSNGNAAYLLNWDTTN